MRLTAVPKRHDQSIGTAPVAGWNDPLGQGQLERCPLDGRWKVGGSGPESAAMVGRAGYCRGDESGDSGGFPPAPLLPACRLTCHPHGGNALALLPGRRLKFFWQNIPVSLFRRPAVSHRRLSALLPVHLQTARPVIHRHAIEQLPQAGIDPRHVQRFLLNGLKQCLCPLLHDA